jgi:hypothetical protein
LLMSILTCFQWGKDKAPVQAVRLISKLCLTQRPLKVSQLSISNFINSPLSLHGRTRNNISRQSCSYQQQRTSECAIYTNLRQFMGLTPSPENMQYREAASESRPIQRRSHDPRLPDLCAVRRLLLQVDRWRCLCVHPDHFHMKKI